MGAVRERARDPRIRVLMAIGVVFMVVGVLAIALPSVRHFLNRPLVILVLGFVDGYVWYPVLNIIIRGK